MDVIIAVEYDWFFTKDDGENVKKYEVGFLYGKMGKCMRIDEIETGGFRVWFDTGRTCEIFNINSVYRVANDDRLLRQNKGSDDKTG